MLCEAHIPPEKKLFLVSVRFRQSDFRVGQNSAEDANLSFQTVHDHGFIQIAHRPVVLTVDEMAVEKLLVLPLITIYIKLCGECIFIVFGFFAVL